MTGNTEFLGQLIVARDAKQADIEKNLVPKIKENCSLFHSHYQALYEMLLNKGVLKADPYKNERHLSDISMPQDPPMAESEVEDQLPIRLAEFDNLLDFLVNYTQFSVSTLTLKRLKIILGIIKYINWSSLTTTSPSPSTKGLAAILDKIRLGNDAMASGAITGNHNSLDKLSHQIQKDIKTLADYKREEYKIAMRESVLPAIGAANLANRDDTIKKIKQVFPRTLPGEAYFPELVNELLDELGHEDSESFRQEVLERFHVEQTRKKVETGPKIDLLGILLEAARTVGTSSRHLEESVAKLNDNHELLITRPRSFFERFKEWIISLAGKKTKEHEYSVELIDVVTTMKRIEVIPFESFIATVGRKARQYAALASRASALYVKLEQSPEGETYEFLNKVHKELRDFHEKLDALDLYLKTEVPPSDRQRLRGIKTELTALKNSITMVNQKLHEYIARKEEMEQLKKLGIQVGSTQATE